MHLTALEPQSRSCFQRLSLRRALQPAHSLGNIFPWGGMLNISLGADTQQQNAATRRLLRAGQLER